MFALELLMFFFESGFRWLFLGEYFFPNYIEKLGIYYFFFDRLALWFGRNIFVISIVYWFYFKFLNKRSVKRQIVPAPSSADIKREIMTGALASFLALSGIMFYLQALQIYFPGLMKYYLDIEQYGIGYFIFSIFALFFFNDIYFYFVHRTLHTPFFFKKIHYVHHKSIHTNPVSGISFHPIEAFLLYIFPNLLFLFLPMHPLALSIFGFITVILVALGHAGWECIPHFLREKPFSYLLCNSFHHALHHKEMNKNYSLHFNYLDHLLGTNSPNYYKELEQFNKRFKS